MITSSNNNQNSLRPLSSRNITKFQKPTTSVFQIGTKNTFHVQQDSSREFGKDITNVSLLTATTQNIPNENINSLNNGSKLNESVLEKKLKNLGRQKEDLTQKLKNYDIKVQTYKHSIPPNRSQSFKQCMLTQGNLTEENIGGDITMKYNGIINNDIITGECLNELDMNRGIALTEANETYNATNHLRINMNDDQMVIDEEKEEMEGMTPQNYTQGRLINDSMKSSNAFTSTTTPAVISNPQQCKEYINDIYNHLRNTEQYFLPKFNYMSSQPDINEKMRGILVDWLIEVHLKYKLVPETMFLTTNIIDRYLEQKTTMRSKLQLVGVAAMFIACKYEEIFAPEVGDFVYITDNAYKKNEVIKMESDILATLSFNVTVPSSYRFLEIYNNSMQFDKTIFYFAWYLLELTMIDVKMMKYQPSILASSACLISLKIMKMYSDDDLDKVTGYPEEQLKDCSRDICALLQNTEKSSLQAIKKKFSLPKYLEVSKIKFL